MQQGRADVNNIYNPYRSFAAYEHKLGHT